MMRFVSLAVFALMAVGVFGTDAAAQGFSWNSAAPDPAQPTVLKAYPWFEVQGVPAGMPAANKWRTGKGSVAFGYSPFPMGNKWTVTKAYVKTYTMGLNGTFDPTARETIAGTFGDMVVNAAQSSSSSVLTFNLNPDAPSGFAGYTPNEMVRVEVYINATASNGGFLKDEMIDRSTVAATPP